MSYRIAATVLFCIFVLPLAGCDRGGAAKRDVNGATRRAMPHDPKAHDVLRSFSEFLAAAETVQVKIVEQIDVLGTSLPPDRAEYEFLRVANTRAALRLTQGLSGATVICDGSQLFVSTKAFKDRYQLTTMPSSLGEIPRREMIGMEGYSCVVFAVASLFQDDAYAYLTEHFEIGGLLPDAALNGTLCFRLEAAGPEYEHIVWIEQGPRPLLRRVEQTSWKPPEPTGNCIHMTIDLADWRLDEPLPDGRFCIVLPQNAEQGIMLGASPSDVLGELANEKQTTDSPATQQAEQQPATPRLNENASVTNQAPAAANENPAMTNEYPAAANEYPAAANVNPAMTNEYPAAPNVNPAVTNEYPAAPNVNPAVTNEYPAAANASHTLL